MPRVSTTPPTSNPTTATADPVDDTTEHNNQDLNEHEESIHDADSNPCFDEIPGDDPEDKLDRRLDNESNAQSGRLVCSKRNHVVDPSAEPDLLEASKDDCQAPPKTVGPSCP